MRVAGEVLALLFYPFALALVFFLAPYDFGTRNGKHFAHDCIKLLEFGLRLWCHICVPSELQHYWGGLCLCGKYHPVKLATADENEPVPRVAEYTVMCPTRLDDIRFEMHDLVKYVGPADGNFQTHQLFQEPDNQKDHD